ncbi:MAG: kelch domain-containing protein, partial [Pyrinomonadaceae bacterium]|nr:kelch domain-containing protein [Pyrinomonadaceae bacterium]
MTWPYAAIHAHLLPTGKVLFWSKRFGADNNHSQLWNPESNSFTAATNPAGNIFCAGEAFLPDGRLLVAGGHVDNYVGLPDAYTYKPSTNTWTRLPDMNNGRWYPTNTPLPNGDVLVIAGQIDISQGMNTEPQVWQTATGTWRNLSTAQLALPFYPFMHVAPNGKVFCAGPNKTTRYLDVAGTGAWSTVASSNYGTRNWGSSVMYEDGKVLLMGGTTCGAYASTCTALPTATAEIIDLNSATPAWRYTGSMGGGRKLQNATLLPDGKVLVTGGSRGSEDPNSKSSDPAYSSELWDPATNTWATMASLKVFRGYHSIALLLPDGRVLSAGGEAGTNGDLADSAEIYSPPYLFKGSR